MKRVILPIIVILVIAGVSYGAYKWNISKDIIGPEEARIKIEEFINNNLMQAGSKATVKEIIEEGNLYKVVVALSNDQEIESYLTKDGKKFFPQVLDIEETEEQTQAEGTQNEPKEIPKSGQPEVELFVMSFCPYGVQAENAMAPVVNLLGGKVDIKVRYIASVSGEDLDSVKSLHGVIEGKEDARQLCVAKNYDEETFWEYILAINKDCYPVYRQGDKIYNECWQKAAKAAGVSTSKLDTCMTNEGVELINTEDTVAKKYGVTGSPTLIINGQRANASRTPEGYKTVVCDAFNNPPEECNQTLGSEGGGASGDCN